MFVDVGVAKQPVITSLIILLFWCGSVIPITFVYGRAGLHDALRRRIAISVDKRTKRLIWFLIIIY